MQTPSCNQECHKHVMHSCWQNVVWCHTSLYSHMSVLKDKAFHTTDIVTQCQCSWSSYVGFISQINSTILECSVPHGNVFLNHHALLLHSDTFPVNLVCISCLVHAGTESHLAPPCWSNFPVSQILPLLCTHVHNLHRHLAISTSKLTLVLHMYSCDMLFWPL
jgi:hypothetical protein